jgi:hypothetical protein
MSESLKEDSEAVMTSVRLLPEQFADLEPFAQTWVLPTANERCQRRLESSMEEMQAFYKATLPRGDEMFDYLDQFDFEDLPEPAVHLMWLLCSLSAVSFSVDVFKQPGVPDSAGATLPIVLEPEP